MCTDLVLAGAMCTCCICIMCTILRLPGSHRECNAGQMASPMYLQHRTGLQSYTRPTRSCTIPTSMKMRWVSSNYASRRMHCSLPLPNAKLYNQYATQVGHDHHTVERIHRKISSRASVQHNICMSNALRDKQHSQPALAHLSSPFTCSLPPLSADGRHHTV